MGRHQAEKPFIHPDFLLDTETAKTLYHDYAKALPIIDYHCHLSPKDISEDRVFDSVSKLWLDGDHYKWRALRTLGIDEDYLTGKATDHEKFIQFASAIPYLVRNPLYHWTHLELKRYFDIDVLLSEKNAREVYEQINSLTNSTKFSTQSLLQKMKVELICTTDDPIDDLSFHKKHLASNTSVAMKPSFRPDKAIHIQAKDFNNYIDLLEEQTGLEINSFQLLCEALQKRMDYFHGQGCRLSDHGLTYLPFKEASDKQIEELFSKRRKGENLEKENIEQFQTALLLFLGKAYHRLGWAQQFHLGAMRNNNTRMFTKLGPDSGWDSIGSYPIAHNLSRYLDALDKNNQLSKTILYNLNPADNEIMATMIGNFNDGSSKGKIQWGSGWWFLDQLDGMTNQINTLSNMSVLSCFVGMLTDSRSFLSFPRHEYFRRLLCNLFGNDIEKGLLPRDFSLIGKIIADISYHNAKNYFDFQ